MKKLLIALALIGLLAGRSLAHAADAPVAPAAPPVTTTGDAFDWEGAAQAALAEAEAYTAPPVHRGFFHHLAENWQKNVVTPLRQLKEEQENFKHPVAVNEGPLTLWSNWTWSEDHGVVEVWGSITNQTQYVYQYVEVRFLVMDKDGNQLGIALANTPHLDANGTWRFHALALDASGARKVAPFIPRGD